MYTLMTDDIYFYEVFPLKGLLDKPQRIFDAVEIAVQICPIEFRFIE